jgi:hypothetical protein
VLLTVPVLLQQQGLRQKHQTSNAKHKQELPPCLFCNMSHTQRNKLILHTCCVVMPHPSSLYVAACLQQAKLTIDPEHTKQQHKNSQNQPDMPNRRCSTRRGNRIFSSMSIHKNPHLYSLAHIFQCDHVQPAHTSRPACSCAVLATHFPNLWQQQLHKSQLRFETQRASLDMIQPALTHFTQPAA